MVEIGTLVKEKYRVLKEIQRNYASVGYIAIDEKLNKSWMIKEFRKAIKNDVSSTQKLIVEGKTLCSLEHPNLHRVVDIIDGEDSFILVAEHIEGNTLDMVLNESGPIPQSIIIEWAKQICDALSYLHWKINVSFFKNISLANIVLKPDGNIVITDYFIVTEFNNNYLSDTTCLGSKGYSAPEEFANMVSLDIRTDIYHFGAILHHLVTGISPIESPYEMKSIREINSDFSSELEDVINKCTQLSPVDRYQTADELRYALEHYECANQYYKRTNKLRELVNLIRPFSKKNSRKKAAEKSVKDVRFSALAPKNFLKGEYTIVNIIMYEDEYKNIVIQNELNNEIGETTTGYFSVVTGIEVRVELSSPDVDIVDNSESLVWNGCFLKFQFAVYLPDDYSKKQILFNSSVYFNNVIATKIKFIAKCSSMREQKMKVFRDDILTAFISYASQDRNRVALIIQGMRKSRPDMEIFFDVDALRSGDNWEKTLMQEIDNSDILFLCWSKFAKDSEWVDAEWRYALANKGIDSIEPIPLDPPNVCPPPKELGGKHFNDRELYYRFME